MTNSTLSPHSQQYRAHTPEQKHEIIERLYTVWLTQPELRLGQLITSFGRGLYNTEDFDLIIILESIFLPRQEKENDRTNV